MPPTPKIHILGLGNLGRLFAHALATSPQIPPATIILLFHRSSLVEDWENAGRRIEIASKDLTSSSSSSNYSVEVVDPNTCISPRAPNQKPAQNENTLDPELDSNSNTDLIENLIITTKTLHTVRALTPLAHRLNRNSTLLFAQNGMGTIEEVTTALFSNPSTRPRYLAAITSHGVYSTGPFRSVHAGLANVTVGPVEPQLEPSSGSGSGSLSLPNPSFEGNKADTDINPDTGAQQASYLLQSLTSAPLLSATSVSASSLKYLQLEKLTMNAILNPLTAILHIKNGEILNHAPVRKLTRLLVEECSQILLSLPELQSPPSAAPTSSSTAQAHQPGEDVMTLEQRFSPTRLGSLVIEVAQKTAANTSSMLQDVQAGRETEIEYINGYFVRRAREAGVECGNHERIVKMVRDGVWIGVGEVEGWFPDVKG
ncbi:ketopantoate reductase PanE/ApbA C terminal-domain-containing protein [Rhexocercosporidium sp. MPI-PUGE-AT-0058]|nr:ketopantoate reductase PanE/ApbA C terminal-domain-containing protein [Rhexocercosporidium sp. MPI-PUGE-AT-0058]